MAHINTNFDDVPESFQPVPAGIYSLRFDEAPTVEEARSGKGVNVIARHVIDGGEYDGRPITNYMFQSDLGKITLKRMALSAGVAAGDQGLDLEDFVGTVCRAQITQRTYKDDDGIEKVTNSVKDYLLEGQGE